MLRKEQNIFLKKIFVKDHVRNKTKKKFDITLAGDDAYIFFTVIALFAFMSYIKHVQNYFQSMMRKYFKKESSIDSYLKF